MLRATLATVLCVGGGLSLVAVAAGPTTQPAPSAIPSAAVSAAPKPTTTASKYPVIVHVVSRDKTVTVSSGPKGPVYSLALNDGGKVLLADASAEEFAKAQPELYRMFRNTLAVKTDVSEVVPATDSAEVSAGVSAGISVDAPVGWASVARD